MASLEHVFKRHSRAQAASVPLARQLASSDARSEIALTTPAPALRSDSVIRRSRVLNAQSSPSWVSSAQPSKPRHTPLPVQAQICVPDVLPVPQPNRSPAGFITLQWLDLLQLGTLVQGCDEWLLCSSRAHKKLYMLRAIQGEVEKVIQRVRTMNHSRIVAAAFAVSSDVQSFIGFQYVRYTLEEMLYVHLVMDEMQIRAVATSVFEALKFIHDAGYMHGAVNLRSIRVCGSSGKVMLSDCEHCIDLGTDTSTDLECLGLCLIDCMEGKPKHLTIEQVRRQRATNRVFGLTDSEQWSGHKQLIDFVDDVFSIQRKWQVKYERPHLYVASSGWNEGALLPLAALAPMECFALWQKAT